MTTLARLRSLRQQLHTAAGARTSTELALGCSLSSESAEEIVVISWSSYPPAELDPEEQAALDAIGVELGRPVRMHSWSEHVQPMLAGSDELSEEEMAAAKAEVRAVLGKAVAWFGAPLRWWDEVKALVREECAGAEWPPSLRWIHNTFTGVDMIAAAEPPSSVIVTNMRGRFDVTIAEFVLAWMLMACKQMATLLKQHTEANWPSLPRAWADGGTTLLRGKTVAIIGLGSIGSAMAEMYNQMGMKILGLRRTATPGQTPPPFVDKLYPLSDLHAVLGLADFVVLAMPQTPQTEGMIGAAELAAMQPHAALMNIARGGVAVWDDVLAALRAGEIGAYYTDVADTYVADGYGEDDVTPASRFVSNLRKLLTDAGELDGVCDMSPGAGY